MKMPSILPSAARYCRVAALAGHVTTAAGEEVLFAIYANEAPDGAEARARIDRWVELIAAHAGRF